MVEARPKNIHLHLGEMILLGERAASVSGFGMTFEGALADMIHKWAYLYRMSTLGFVLQVLRH